MTPARDEPGSEVKRAGPRLVFFITEDWFFCSHFLSRARAARAAGFEVSVICRERAHGERIRAAGLGLVPLEIERSGVNPLRDLRLIARLVRLYRQLRPDVVHHIAAKPILYGTLAAKLAGIRVIVNAPVGMGFVFTSTSWKARLLRPLLFQAYRQFLDPGSGRVVLENRDDLRWLVNRRLVAEGRAVLIRGAGIDPGRFRPGYESVPPIVVLVARLLWDKGIGEFVEAARTLRRRCVEARFVLVGETDPENPASVPDERIRQWQREGVVECWGRREDVAEILAGAAIACLPSYREGLPKALLEAAACGLPLVATDVPGCREVVEHGVNGLRVPMRDAAALADALARLLAEPELRRRFGAASRRLAEQAFTEDKVNARTMELYRSLLK